MTDAELVGEIKKGNQEAKLELWKKFEPMVKKNSFKYKWLFGTTYDYDDFYQDAWFSFEEAVSYYDEVNHPEISFMTIFYFFIKRIVRKLSQERNKAFNTVDIDMLAMAPSMDLLERKRNRISSKDIMKASIPFASQIEKANVQATIQKLREVCSDREKLILDYYVEGMPMTTISATTGIKYGTVKYIVNGMKHKAETIYEEVTI